MGHLGFRRLSPHVYGILVVALIVIYIAVETYYRLKSGYRHAAMSYSLGKPMLGTMVALSTFQSSSQSRQLT